MANGRTGLVVLAGALLFLAAGAHAGTPAVHALITWHGGSHVVVTADAKSWRDVTPHHLFGDAQAVAFVGSRQGWLVSGDCAAAKARLARTSDGGRTWSARPFLATSCAAGAGIGLDFLDSRLGWAEHIEPTAPFESLYRTRDGGATWHLVAARLPWLGAVAFRTPRDAWLGGRFLGRSRDGGRTWRRVRLAVPPGACCAEVPGTGFFPPRFFGRHAVVVGGFARGAQLIVRSYTTGDTGRHWRKRSQFRVPWRHGAQPDVLASSPARGVAWVAAFGEPVVAVTTDGGRTWSRHVLRIRGARSIGQLFALDARTAVVQTFPGFAFSTHDGGATWRQAPV